MTRRVLFVAAYGGVFTLLLALSSFGQGSGDGWSTGDAAQEEFAIQSTTKSPDTSKWKVYRNEKYGFEVIYPETWTVHSSKGTPPEVIYFVGPYRGVIGQTLNITTQLNMNPRNLPIEEWFAERLRIVDTNKLEAKGCSTVGGQPACSFEHTDKSGKERSIFTFLHKTDVLSFSYRLGTEDSPNCVAIVDSFRVLK